MSTVRIMTSNLWGDYFKNPVGLRYENLFAVYGKYAPDILCLQEATPAWHEVLGKLSGLVPADRKAVANKNYVPLFFNPKKFELVESGFVHYHLTLDRTKGITWAVLKDKLSGKILAAASTHFWWEKGVIHDYVRTVNAEKLAKKLISLSEKYQCPVFAGGDLNALYSSEAFDVLRSYGFDSVQFSLPGAPQTATEHGDPVLGDDGFYHGRTTDKSCHEETLDHLLYRETEAKPLSCEIITDREALSSSDHSPVLSEFVTRASS